MDATTATRRLNANWYCIYYSPAAPQGLPPVIQAARMLRYADDAGTWVVAVWDSANNEDSVPRCVLRVQSDHVTRVTRHADMGSAVRESYFGTATHSGGSDSQTGPDATKS